MRKSKQTPKPEKAKANQTAVNAVVKAFAGAYGTMAASGTLVHSCVQVSRKFYKGKDIPSVDRTAILAKLERERGWKGASARIRRNEADSILKAYAVLTDLIKKFSSKNSGLCAWHEVVSLARAYNKQGTVLKAVAFVRKRPATNSKPATVGEAKAKAASSIKALLKLTKLPKAFRAELAELCTEYGIRV